MKILVTGGAGYIGSHAVRALLAAGHTPVVLDNLSRGHRGAVPADVAFIEMDIADPALGAVLAKEQFDGVMHFAAHSQVGESMVAPNIYYENNVVGSYRLIEAIREAQIPYVVFSSTAAVYGEPDLVPIPEDAKLAPTNVYGRTKLMIERMLSDYSDAYGLRYVALRYFNAAGADESACMGEDHEPETHLIPLVLQAAQGKRDAITVFGTDYPTPDGTCIRDYIHVTDLAEAHVLAMEYLAKGGASTACNLGTGRGFSVKEIIEAAKRVTGVDFKVILGDRRAGDPGTLIASPEKAQALFGWQLQYSDVDRVITDAWRWHQAHPNGFEDK